MKIVSFTAHMRRIRRFESRLDAKGRTEPVCWMVLSCGHNIGMLGAICNQAAVLCPLCARIEP